ncbi:MAG TPA: putative ABC exporter domain-containing protein [Gemmatimonadales bacterium]|nr:putative ABC exporter domain-containing protein [Gemmatimonadales bacterium]
MIAAALYLSRRSWANSLRTRLLRLRQPKYMVAFSAGVFYLWVMFLRPGGAVSALSLLAPESRETVAMIFLAGLLLANWTFNTNETPFPFTLAETQFLFAAPLTRRQVLLFKIFRSQMALATSAVITVFLFRRGTWSLATPIQALGLWLAYAVVNLNNAGMGLLRLSLAQHGVAGVRRRIGTLTVIAGLVGAIWWVGRSEVPVIGAAFGAGWRSGFAALTEALHTGGGAILSWPLRAVVDPFLARSPHELLSALPAGLLVFGLHVWWVVGSSIAFEESATDHAQRTAKRIAALRAGRGWTEPRAGRSRPLTSATLTPAGSAAGAIVWKNRLGIKREFTVRSLVLVGVATAIGVMSLRGQRLTTTDLLGAFLLFGACMVTLLGPIALRFDLRRDLEMLEVLKTYPVRGRTVVMGEVGALLLVLSLVAGGLTTAAFLLTIAEPSLPPLGDRLAILVSALAGIPAVIAVFLLVQNTSVLLFPAWITVGPQRAVGLEATGQRLILTIGSLLALVVALVPAALLFVLVMVVSEGLVGGPWSVALGAVTGAAAVGGECWLAIQLLGGVYDRLDPSSAGIPSA